MSAPTLIHQKFWARMEENSKLVERMPAWVKGSPINLRTESGKKVTTRDDTSVAGTEEVGTDRSSVRR